MRTKWALALVVLAVAALLTLAAQAARAAAACPYAKQSRVNVIRPGLNRSLTATSQGPLPGSSSPNGAPPVSAAAAGTKVPAAKASDVDRSRIPPPSLDHRTVALDPSSGLRSGKKDKAPQPSPEPFPAARAGYNPELGPGPEPAAEPECPYWRGPNCKPTPPHHPVAPSL